MPEDKLPIEERLPFGVEITGIMKTMVGASLLLGLTLMMMPAEWFGPTWHYYPLLPHGGSRLGFTIVLMSIVQSYVIYRRGIRALLPLGVLMFLAGFVFWTSAFLLGAEGLQGHTGLAEVPLLLWMGVIKFAFSSALITQAKKIKLQQESAGVSLPVRSWKRPSTWI